MRGFEVQSEFIRLRAGGWSLQAIADKIGIAKSTCCVWEKRFAAEIGDLRQVELEALYRECEATIEARLRTLHDTLKKVNAAVADADFSAIPADKLLDIQFKLIQTMGNYYHPIDLHRSVSELLDGTDLEYPDDWARQAEKDAKRKIHPDSIQENAKSDQK